MLVDSEESLAEAITQANDAGRSLRVLGHNTKACMLREVQADGAVSTAGLQGVTLYAPKELVFGARAGTALAAVEAVLAAEGQQMISEPPDYAELLGAADGGGASLGGVVATNLSGPRRVAAGAVRDHVLGVRAINGRGEVIRSGGRVLKNVTGLDLCKLLAGSHGTLGVLTEVTLKVLPAAETSASLVLRGLAPAQAVAALAAALGSAFGVSGAAFVPGDVAGGLGKAAALTLARLEDFAPSVAYRAEKLAAVLGAFGAVEIWPEARSRAAWEAIRHARLLRPDPQDCIWRVSVRPSRGPAVLAAAQGLGLSGFMDWGGGLLMLAGPATLETHRALCAAVRQAGGVWMVLRAGQSWRQEAELVPAEPVPLARLTTRIKAAMDPRGILNPGRMFAGV